MSVKYYYELTGGAGATLFESLSDHHFDRLIIAEAERIEKDSVPGGDMREEFVEYLYDDLDKDDISALKAEAHVLADADEGSIKKWLFSNACHVVDENLYIQDWVSKEANRRASDGFYWGKEEKEDDVCAALTFGLIAYPESLKAKIDGVITQAKEISGKISPEAKGEAAAEALEELVTRIEQEELAKLIKVSGFYCEIHEGRARFKEPLPRSEVLTCPSCEHPICPVCANSFTEDPTTEEDARRFLKSCDTPSGDAWCGECGDYGMEFMLRFLKLKKCPIPQEFLEKSPPKRPVKYVATAAVAKLPEIDLILKQVKEKFESGVTGIIKVDHSAGVIWAKPDRYPDEWVVTLLYPSEY